jgi:transposase-like protein
MSPGKGKAMRNRRAFSAEFKARVVLEVLSGAKNAAEVCREHQIKPQLFASWKAQFLENAPQVFEQERNHDESNRRISELERLLGQKTLELEIAKKASNILTSHQSRNGKL